MNYDNIQIDEHCHVEAFSVNLYGANLLILKGKKGFLACGYVNPVTAEKLGHACAIVSGVKNYDDMLKASVIAVSTKATQLGVNIGMSGKEAMLLLA